MQGDTVWPHTAPFNGGVYMSKTHQIVPVHIVKGLISMENGT